MRGASSVEKHGLTWQEHAMLVLSRECTKSKTQGGRMKEATITREVIAPVITDEVHVPLAESHEAHSGAQAFRRGL